MIFTNLKFFIFVTYSITVGYCFNDTNETDADGARKRYGYGFYSSCADHKKVFECMSICQSLDYQAYRLDHRCKCSCHEMRSTLALPFFKWLTTGTPKTLPTTRSPRLYDIVGTLSPNPFTQTTKADNNTCPTLSSETANNHTKAPVSNNTSEENSNQTESNGTDTSSQTESLGTDTSTPPSGGPESSAPQEGNATTSNAEGSSSNGDKSSDAATEATSVSVDTEAPARKLNDKQHKNN